MKNEDIHVEREHGLCSNALPMNDITRTRESSYSNDVVNNQISSMGHDQPIACSIHHLVPRKTSRLCHYQIPRTLPQESPKGRQKPVSLPFSRIVEISSSFVQCAFL